MPTRPHRPAAIRQADIIEGLGKGLRVIEAFDEDHPRLTASEAADLAAMTRTAARRYLLSLVHFGYADTDGKHFWLAPRVLRLGQSYLGAARIPRLVQPFVQRLSQELGDNINFSVLDEHEVVYVARSLSNQMMTIGFPVGARVPAHVVTPGVAILSTFSEARLAHWIAAHAFSAFTPRTTTDPQRFLADVQTARALGYWVTEQQLTPGLRGLAMPVKNARGQCVGAIGLTTTMSPRSREELVEAAVPRISDVVQVLRNIL
ncbi:helix-turn-helix domain-containing protein [Ideonella sp. 4Y16]|uniref:IclR family transcriptional regulator domain-containing protein n=1 Tax=Ideonella alba TaxID=2824118 RepID=UPI001B395338|nr:IclR family transcriptional regulator C-terminal domain-containing protein [Ideonella alba]MBQ0945496.1 helix-turn-helix domain-containing protein [Ideonella alba]